MFLDKIIKQVEVNLENGYYEVDKHDFKKLSLVDKLKSNEFSLIAEIKHKSPLEGILLGKDIAQTAKEIAKAGASAISVVVEPTFFNGNIYDIATVKKVTKLPVLVKDFVIDFKQIEAAKRIGADAILLISLIFNEKFTPKKLNEMIAKCHAEGLEVILEVNNIEEFKTAQNSEADIIGINNRNLETMKVDLTTTKEILSKIRNYQKLIISESGIKSKSDIDFLRNFGVNGVLIGTSILQSSDIEKKIKELIGDIYG